MYVDLDESDIGLYHCYRTVGIPYFVFAPDCPIDQTTIFVKPHIGRKMVRDIKWCVVIFSPQSYLRSQAELYDLDRSAFCLGQ